MALPLDEALALYPTLSSDVRAAASRIAFADAAHVAFYVKAACRIGGMHVDDQGHVVPGEDGFSAEASAARFGQLAAENPGLMRAADTAIKAALDRAQRLAAVVHALYDAGLALQDDGTIAGG